jgi:hypothetical protein
MESLNRREFVKCGGMLVAAPLMAFPPSPLQGQGWEDLLSRSFSREALAEALLPLAGWKPFPAAADRSGWEGLPPDASKVILDRGEKLRGSRWDPLPASVFLGYKRTGNRSNYEKLRDRRRAQLAALVMAECVQGEGRFLDDVADGIWATCEETFWGVPAHLNMQKAGPGLPDAGEPVVDLFAAETSSLMAWTDYLLASKLDAVSPLLRPRIRAEVTRRILDPCLKRNDFWWMGLDPDGRDLNNWTPWIVSNWLASALFMSNEPERSAAVHKSLRCLDRFLSGYAPDGGCDEGPSYWFRAGGSLFDCLEVLHSASAGKVDFFRTPLVAEIGRYICRAHICDDYFVDFADASAKVRMDGNLVFRYGKSIADARMQAHGAFAAERAGWIPSSGESIGRQLGALFNLAAIRNAPKRQPFIRDAWFPGMQVVTARKRDGSAEGLYMAAQGGHNAESHNHNDVGNFIVYADGLPAIIDVGVETYTAKTFSPQRYEIWTMQSGFHNLPTVNGVMQSAGRKYAARDVACKTDDSAAEFSLDIAQAFPPEAGLRSWRRRLSLDRKRNEIELRDDYVLERETGPITQTLMTPCRILQSEPGTLTLEGAVPFPSGKIRILFDPSVFAVKTEEIEIEDARLKESWGDRVFRILMARQKPGTSGTWTLRITQA